ncbi:MAG: histidinol-phosphate transaminase [Bacteriovoracaceae bacterium]|jgi:histidinol-phosphate aminotransferase|nr:histidinol-phosphate transaminase [Bacteriovoracaceae bacterium]
MATEFPTEKSLIPSHLRDLKAYQAGKPVEELAREMGLEKISKLASNENPLGPSPYAIKEMTQGLWNLHNYPDMHAFKLTSMLAKLYNLKRENIILGNGSEGIMSYISRAFIQPGDEVLTSEHTFVGFYIVARASGAKLKTVPLTSDYRFDVKALAKNITPKTKIIYIANPNNPTGTYITKREFDELLEAVPKNVLIILDEAYYEFAKQNPDYPDSMDYRYDNFIILRTFSKAYGLAGIRVGYGFAHENLISNLKKVKLPFEPNLIAQLGACGAIHDQPHLERTLRNNKKRSNETKKYLKKNGFDPIDSVTNFILFKVGTEEKANFLFEELLKLGVIIRPMKAHGMPEYVRVSIGTKSEMNHFFDSMDIVLKKL